MSAALDEEQLARAVARAALPPASRIGPAIRTRLIRWAAQRFEEAGAEELHTVLICVCNTYGPNSPLGMLTLVQFAQRWPSNPAPGERAAPTLARVGRHGSNCRRPSTPPAASAPTALGYASVVTGLSRASAQNVNTRN